MFINRNMLFTALSRARQGLRVFGQDTDLRRIAATPCPERNSDMVRRVLKHLESIEDEDEEANLEHVTERQKA